MCGVSDIPDWCWNEAGLPYTWLPADPVLLDVMWRKSPVSHVEEVTAPVFLMIGQENRDGQGDEIFQVYTFVEH